MRIFQSFSQTGCRSAKWMSTFTMRRAVPAIVCLLMLAAAGVASAQTTYWVSPNGNDTNAGTYSQPFQTFQRAADAAQVPGDTVVFMDGTYTMGCPTTSDIYIWDPPSFATTQGWEYRHTATGGPICDAAVLDNQGTASEPITFMAEHRGKAILDGNAGSAGWGSGGNCGGSNPTGANSYIDFYNAQYVVIQGFTIQNTCTNAVDDNYTGEAIYAPSPNNPPPTQGAQNITLRWNDMGNIAYDQSTSEGSGSAFYCGGLAGYGPTGVVIDGNSFHDLDSVPSVGNALHDAMYINCPDVTITNNIVYNLDNGFDIQVAGVETAGNEGAENVLIANNTFGPTDPEDSNPTNDQNNLYSEIVIWQGYQQQPIYGVTIQNNIFYNYRPGGYELDAIDGQAPNVYDCVLDSNIVTNSDVLYKYRLKSGNEGNDCQPINETGLLDIGSSMMMAPDCPANATCPTPEPSVADPNNSGYDLVSGSVAIDHGDFLAPPPPSTPPPTDTVYYPTPYLSGFAFGNTDFAKRCRPQDSGDIAGDHQIDIGAFQYPQTCE